MAAKHEEGDLAGSAPSSIEPQMLAATLYAQADDADAPKASKPDAAERPTAVASRRRGGGLGARLFLLLLALGLIIAGFGMTGKTVRLPVWAVAEVENRLNHALEGVLPKGAVSVGAIEMSLDANWSPQLQLDDLRLLQTGGRTLLTLPQTHLLFDRTELLAGRVRVKTLRVVGADIAVTRDRSGKFNFNFGTGQGPKIDSLAALFAETDRIFALPAMSQLGLVEGDALSLQLSDARSGRSWQVSQGYLQLDNRATDIVAELGLSLQTTNPSRAVFRVVTAKGSGTAEITATVDQIAAIDLAAQLAPLAWLKLVDAPISGQVSARIDRIGVRSFDGQLQLGAGALHPGGNATPIAFDQASMGIGYDAASGRLGLSELHVKSPALTLAATGQAYLLDGDGGFIKGPLSGRWPQSFLGQIALTQLELAPDAVFEAPLIFTQGSADLRLGLDPFTLDVGQLVLIDGTQRLVVKGQVAADPSGWRAAIDLALNRISIQRLLQVWPLGLIPKTRDWARANVSNASFTDIAGALRLVPGVPPQMQLNYNFADMDVKFMPTMPPITGAAGYATIAGKDYTQVLSKGLVLAPQGGAVDLTGSAMTIPDIYAHPARARIRLAAGSSLTAALSILNQPPFHFLDKAGQPVTLGEGRARIGGTIELPLQRTIGLNDVAFTMDGRISDFKSGVLVPGHLVAAPGLAVRATPAGMRVSGVGLLGKLPFDVALLQEFRAKAPPTRIEGKVDLSQATIDEFGLGLPRGMVTGKGQGRITLDLPKGEAGRLSVESDLSGLTLAIPEVGWRKSANAAGRLTADIRLGASPLVERLTLSGAGMEAAGRITFTASGDLDVAKFDRVRLAGWLDGGVEITGHGARPVGLAVTSGSIVLGKFPADRGSSGESSEGSDVTLRLSRMQVTDSIAVEPFRGDFSLRGGFNGNFSGQINGKAPITGTVAPSKNGTAVRVEAVDAGAVIAAAGLFASARGGALQMTLIPRPAVGQYDGTATIRSVRVVDANVLAELLNAISVVGLLEQLNGPGLQFNDVEAGFLMTPDAIQVQHGSAVGASLGVSMSGIYRSTTQKLEMDGVISPFYLLNGIGAILTRRGEGLFGFNYRLTGTANDPQVSVNPLSILTPGMFRDIFRQPPPKLEGQ